jgi:predicted HD phosphohydrolase
MTISSEDEHISYLFDLMSRQDDSNYIGENISQRAHFLQAAHLAVLSNCDENTAIAALLHDIGQILPLQVKDAARKARDIIDEDGINVGRVGHEKIGENYLRAQGWPNDVCELVGAHVIAKR